jgi:hypothetical protein
MALVPGMVALVRNRPLGELGETRRAAAVLDVQYELALQGSRRTSLRRCLQRRALTSDK